MSVAINWETITSGPDGRSFEEAMRAFIHEKFQQTRLPRFIHSINIHSFQFGTVAPEIEIKDVCDPLPEFYEDDESEDEDTAEDAHVEPKQPPSNAVSQEHLRQLQEQILQARPTDGGKSGRSLGSTRFENAPDGIDPFGGPFPRSSAPGVPGGTSNLSYFHLPVGGLSGTQTPLAAVASGTPLSPSVWQDFHALGNPFQPSTFRNSKGTGHALRASHSPPRPSTSSSLASPPDINTPQDPRSPERPPNAFMPAVKVSDDPNAEHEGLDTPRLDQSQQAQPSDLQVVARVHYDGDVKMMLTAEILLDYPMPSFVGIPLKLSITGVRFDGVAILAYIKEKMYFCFLSPEDAKAFDSEEVLPRDNEDGNGRPVSLAGDRLPEVHQNQRHSGAAHETSLLREIHVDSEIGRQENGKQVLKNVSKVEKFVLEQVRRIFEEELVFPSFWTFLV